MATRFARLYTGASSEHSNLRVRGAAVVAAAVESLERRAYLSTTPPVVNVDWKGHTVQAVQGQYVVQSAHAKAFQSLAAAKGFTGITDLGGSGDFEFTTTLSPSAVQQLAADHTVAIQTIAPNGITKAADTFPDDPLAPLQYYLNNTGQTETFDYNGDGMITGPGTNFPSPPYPNEVKVGTIGDDINAKKAWDYSTGAPTVVVAVLDTGIDLTHPDLVGNIYTNPAEVAGDGIDNDGNGYVDDVNGWNFVGLNNNTADDNGHGTAVAGIIGASGNNGLGVTGVAWNVKILPVKVLGADGTGTDAQAIAGVNYVTALKEQGVNIVALNASFEGIGFPVDVVGSNAVRAAGRAGIVEVIAAGNDSTNNDRTQLSPQQFNTPSSTIISVAATDNQGDLAFFSNYGPQTVDLAAPGINIYSTALGGTYGYVSGTSEAAPQVAGIIALEAAIKPNATPAQLKKALLDGVTFDSALANINGTGAKVRTSGVANAYNAVKNILDQFVSTDTTRQGNWSNFYGSQGAYVVGDTSTFPSFASVDFSGATPVLLKDSTSSAIALQKVSNTSDRIEAYEASAGTESININFTDGLAHRTRLYVADYDRKKRSEQIQIIDTPTGAVLDTENVSNFTRGQYLSWDLRGSVQIRITNVSGPSAVFSGVFFDAPPVNANVFKGTDTTTAGSLWAGKYGSQGEFIVGDPNGSQLPGYAQLAVAGESTEVLHVSTKNATGLQKAGDYTRNVQAFWSSPGSFAIGLNLTDGKAHNVTLYTADYDHKKRAERISVIDLPTGNVLYTEDLTTLGNGTFSTFEVTGDVQFVVTNTGGGKSTAVVSGVFLDGPPGALVSFVGSDNTTAGNWRAAGYGPTSAYIAGQNFAGIDNISDPTLTESGASQYVLSNTSTDPRALQSINQSAANQRIAAYLYTNSSMTINANFTDNLQHRVELYFADYEKLGRSETIAMYSNTTGALLTTQRISGFQKGRYMIYDMRGPVRIVITDDAGPNAVISGLFAD